MKDWKKLVISALILALLSAGCARRRDHSAPSVPEDTGYSATGRDNPNVDRNEYQEDHFVQVGGFTIYTGSGGASHIGVDVSTHQGEINWEMVKEAGVRFAMIRAGFRGYASGGIHQDKWFKANMKGALDAGLQVGVYFFSQSVNQKEAREEARQVLEWIEGYNVTYPVVFDWEEIIHDEARTDHVKPETVTACIKAFCAEIEAAGYTPMVYFNKNQGYDVMDLEQLERYEFWLAGYSQTPNFQYKFEMWQYSCTGSVPGIQGDVDLNICFVDYPRNKKEENPEIGSGGNLGDLQQVG